MRWLIVLLLTSLALADVTPLDHVDKSQLPQIGKKETVRFTTDAGNFTVEVYPEAAPNAAQRFVELVKAGFYDNTPIFRVIPGFVAQFGINWRGDFPGWQKKPFKDDKSWFKLDQGTLAFAKAGPDTNSTQVFINYGDNSRLALNGGFTTFGRVVDGMAVVEKFKSVGDPSGGLSQDRLWADGENYLNAMDEKPNMILKAEVLTPE